MAIAFAVACALAAVTIQDPTPRVRLTNPAPVARQGLVRFSMPWPRGRLWSLDAVRVGDDVAPCVPLERWDDGSLALVQVHARCALAAGADVLLAVEPADLAPDRAESSLGASPPIVTELEDPWGRVHEARLVPDPATTRDDPLASARVVVRRFRGVHARTADDGATECLLPVDVWTTEIPSERRIELTVVLDGDPRVGEPVLGPIRLRRFALRVEDPAWRVLPRFRDALLLPRPTALPDGGFVQPLLGPSDAVWIGDRTRKAFRFDVFVADDAEDPELAANARLAAEQPVLAVPELDWVRATRAFGAHGGPGPVLPLEAAALAAVPGLPVDPLDGGPFGGFGDPRDARGVGVRRIRPSVFGDLLRANRGGPLATRFELLVLQQGLRPTPATAPRLDAATAAFRAGLSPRALERPHGYRACGYETFSVDLLHDAWWLTGDPFARHELARIGSAIPALLAGLPFRTSRGEGAVLRGGVLVARATGDAALLDLLRARFHDVIAGDLGDEDPLRAHAIAQPPHADALGVGEPFDAPWQMAILVLGLHALWSATGDDDVREAALRVARRLAVPCWVDGVGLAAFVSARDPRVRAAPVPGDLGARAVAAAAFAVAADIAGSESDRSLLRARADALAGVERGATAGDGVAESWLQLYHDRTSSER